MSKGGRPPGKPKTGGRKKGSLNKRSPDIEARAKRLGVDPFEIMLLFAKGDWKRLGYETGSKTIFTKGGGSYEIDTISPEMRLKAACEATPYLLPKRRPVDAEGKSEDNANVIYTVSWADEADHNSNAPQDSSAKKNL